MTQAPDRLAIDPSYWRSHAVRDSSVWTHVLSAAEKADLAQRVESWHGRALNTFFIPWYIRRSQELADAPRPTPAEAIAVLEKLANDPSFHLDMQFEPGDEQWLKNAASLHKRTAYEDHAEPDRKRHLIRLWLSAPDFTDGDEQRRRGVTTDNAGK